MGSARSPQRRSACSSSRSAWATQPARSARRSARSVTRLVKQTGRDYEASEGDSDVTCVAHSESVSVTSW